MIIITAHLKFFKPLSKKKKFLWSIQRPTNSLSNILLSISKLMIEHILFCAQLLEHEDAIYKILKRILNVQLGSTKKQF